MYNSVRKKLGTATTNFKKSGMGNPFWDFCSGGFCMPWGSGAGQCLCVMPIMKCPCAVAKQSCGHVQDEKQSCACDCRCIASCLLLVASIALLLYSRRYSPLFLQMLCKKKSVVPVVYRVATICRCTVVCCCCCCCLKDTVAVAKSSDS